MDGGGWVSESVVGCGLSGSSRLWLSASAFGYDSAYRTWPFEEPQIDQVMGLTIFFNLKHPVAQGL